LFVDRAQAIVPDFELAASNWDAIGAICRRLDGLPLAIELAAARMALLAPDAQLRWLGRRLSVLTGGVHDLPERQRTLRATLAWSYDLIEPGDQRLFRLLAVFAGGCTLGAVEAVCAEDAQSAHELAERLVALVDASLVQVRPAHGGDAGPRFELLETIREYAEERLEESGEADDRRRRHFEWCLASAEVDRVNEMSPAHVSALDQENDNLRYALAWSIAAGLVEEGQRLALATFPLWFVRGRYTEGRAWIADLLALDEGATPSTTRARCLSRQGFMAANQGDYRAAQAAMEASLAIARALDDDMETAIALHALGSLAIDVGDIVQADVLHEQALAIERRIGDRHGEALTLLNLAVVALDQGEPELAGRRAAEAAPIFRQSGNVWGYARGIATVAWATAERGDAATATRLLEETLARQRELGDGGGLSRSLLYLARIVYTAGQRARAGRLYAEGLEIAHEAGRRKHLVDYLEDIATLMADSRPEDALRLAGAAGALREALGRAFLPGERERLEGRFATARASLAPRDAAAALDAGKELSLERALEQALVEVRLMGLGDGGGERGPSRRPRHEESEDA
jgi:tetratricopeptide (TPR) repeat protein